jgi:hypothetical protein
MGRRRSQESSGRLKKRSILSANPPASFSDVEEVEDDGEEDCDVLALRLTSSHGTSTQASHRRRLTTTFSTGRCASFEDSRRSGGRPRLCLLPAAARSPKHDQRHQCVLNPLNLGDL